MRLRPLLIAPLLLWACGPSQASAPCADQAGYVACGCGCCGGTTPPIHCLTAEENLCDLIAQDQAQAGSAGCAMAGCSQGAVYQYCFD